MRNSAAAGGLPDHGGARAGPGLRADERLRRGRLDATFWAGTAVRTNFVCTLGQGDPAGLMPRSPRLAFDEACQLV
jgi:3-hydroxypropanoate dehydrogenase